MDWNISVLMRQRNPDQQTKNLAPQTSLRFELDLKSKQHKLILLNLWRRLNVKFTSE